MAIKTQTEGKPESGPTISKDDYYHLLSNNRRRYALHYLEQNGGQATLGNLSEQIAAWENEVDIPEVTADQRKCVYTALQQVHLPRMEEYDVVAFDRRAGEVELDRAAEELDIYLEVVEEKDIPWSEFYLGLAAVNLAVLAAVALNLMPVTGIPDLGWGLFVNMTFVITGLCHHYIGQREMLLGADESPPEVDT